MRLGLITDVHEDVDHLKRSLEALQGQRIDRLVLLGDVCHMSERLEETVAMLAEAQAEGVWGNHDFGLCDKPINELRDDYSAGLLRFMRGLAPRLEIEGCLFTHVEPWLDPTRLEDLWWFEGMPDTPARVGQSLAAYTNRVMFIGHFHRWFAATAEGPIEWRGEAPLVLRPDCRYLIGVGAVCEGWCGVFDTDQARLTPINVRVKS